MGPTLDSATILIVEDNIEVREIFSSALENNGYKVLQAGDGFEALVAIENDRIDVIVTDLRMPRLSGIQLASTLKNSPRFRDLPIIGVTATPLADLEFMLGFFVEVLFKPCDVNLLISAVEKTQLRQC
ncbi:response regulator [Herbaspirillum robiniae]|uniref:response regulator n=1 Tax=Herbaspirillum robiniae TaxID=2014887 RepID=UPI003D788816